MTQVTATPESGDDAVVLIIDDEDVLTAKNQIAKVQVTTTHQTNIIWSDVVIRYNTAWFDPGGMWNNETKRFIPKIAGYYSIYASAHLSWAGLGTAYIRIRPNGIVSSSGVLANAVQGSSIITVNDVLHLNGITDYVDFTVTSSLNTEILASSGSYVTIFLVKAAS